jgi:hypothetical protein
MHSDSTHLQAYPVIIVQWISAEGAAAAKACDAMHLRGVKKEVAEFR